MGFPMSQQTPPCPRIRNFAPRLGPARAGSALFWGLPANGKAHTSTSKRTRRPVHAHSTVASLWQRPRFLCRAGNDLLVDSKAMDSCFWDTRDSVAAFGQHTKASPEIPGGVSLLCSVALGEVSPETTWHGGSKAKRRGDPRAAGPHNKSTCILSTMECRKNYWGCLEPPSQSAPAKFLCQARPLLFF